MFKWLKRRNRLYYLYSNIYLPAPLSEDEEERLLRLVETENDIEARNKLIEHKIYIANNGKDTDEVINWTWKKY